MPATAPAIDPGAASEAFLARIPRDFAREHRLLSQGAEADGHERLAVAAHTPPAAIWNVGVRLRRPVRPQVVDDAALAAAIDAAYEADQTRQNSPGGGKSGEIEALPSGNYELLGGDDSELERLIEHAERDLLRVQGKAPVVRLLDRLLFDALQVRASDLHVQPLADRVVVRRRIDGVLDPGISLPVAVLRPLVSRIKVLGRMDVAERLVPQDGRCSVAIGERSIDIRISTLPTPHGERVVLRLLDGGRELYDFAGLGMPSAIAGRFLAAARKASGIVLVTGPTGSGKTTTLYATLRELDSRERNIMTIEDPIEYELDSLGLPISQSQVNAKKGVTFANGLRHLLRQDPDVILVGEVRDAETARTAIQASLTGHLVFSTLHTNDAVGAVTRLIDLGVEPYLVAASLSAVLAQRLVRVCCKECGGPERTPGGCAACGHAGFRGRSGLFELLSLDEDLRDRVAKGLTLEELRREALGRGMTTLAAAGRELVAAGTTTAVEIERVVHG